MYGQGNILGVWGWMGRVIFGGVGVDGLRQSFYMIWARLLLGDLTLNCYI